MKPSHARQVRQQAASLGPLLARLTAIEAATLAIEELPEDADRATLRKRYAQLHAAYDDAIGTMYHRPTMNAIRATAATMYRQSEAYSNH